jgi:hypothetical protein
MIVGSFLLFWKIVVRTTDARQNDLRFTARVFLLAPDYVLVDFRRASVIK